MNRHIMLLLTLCLTFGSSFGQINFLVWDSTNTSMPSNRVQDLASSESFSDDIWVAFLGQGLTHIPNGGTNYTMANSGLPSDSVYAIAIDNNDDLVVGTTAGLAIKSGTVWTVMDTSNSAIPDNHVRNIHVPPAETNLPNQYFIATPKGIGRYLNGAWIVYDTSNSGLMSNNVIDLGFSDTGLWAITDQGVSRLQNGQWTQFTSSNSNLPNAPLTCVISIDYDYAWGFQPIPWAAVGTQGGGVAFFAGGQWIMFDTLNSAMPSNNIIDLAVWDSGNMLAATDQGMVRLSGWSFAFQLLYNPPSLNMSAIATGSGPLPGSPLFGTKDAGVFIWEPVIGIEDETAEQELKLFPVPAQDHLAVQLERDWESLEIWNLQGQRVWERSALQETQASSELHLDLSTLANGTYFLRARGMNGEKQRKFVLQR